MKTQLNYIEELKNRLKAVAKKTYYKKALEGFFLTVIIILVINLTVSFAELFGAHSVQERTILFLILLAVFFFSVFFFVFIPVLKSAFIFNKPDYLFLAQKVGNQFPEIKDNLVNSIQLAEDAESNNYSGALVEAAVKNVYEKTRDLKFEKILEYSITKRYFRLSLLSIIISTIVFAFIPELRLSSFKILNYNTEFIIPAKFSLHIEPGNVKVAKGDKILISVSAIGHSPETIFLSTQSIEQSAYEEKEITKDSLGLFTYRINNVNNSFNYFASAENISSEVYNVQVVNSPFINVFEATIIPPKYSKLPLTIIKDNGNLTALTGSRVKISIKTNKSISEAYCLFADSSKVILEVKNNGASGGFNIGKSTSYQIILKDTDGNFNVNPISFNITAILDEYPSIEMISPNADIKLGQNNQIPLTAGISDDFGFDKLVLNYRISASQFEQPWKEYKQMNLSIKNTKEQEVYFVWDLKSMVLAVDDVLSYYLEVYDNDNINGPKSNKTALFNIRVPSIDEIFNVAENTQEKAKKDLTELLEETKELSKDLERISNEMKQDNRELTWEEKNKIEKAMQNFEEVSNKVQDVQKKLNEMQKDLQENKLLSEKTLEKYLELQSLMDDLNNKDLKSAMEKLQEMLKNMNRNQTQQAFEEMKFNEELFQKSLERTLNLLKRIQIEQKVDELVKRTEEITNKLDDLKTETNKAQLSDEKKNNELSEKQNQVSKDLQKLNEEMDQLKEKMNEFQDMPVQDLEKMLEQMKQQKNKELSEKTKQQLQQQQQMQAMKNQQQLSQNMQDMKQQMMQMQNNLQMQTQMQSFYEMMKAVNNLLQLSKEQESLKSNTSKTSHSSDQFKENARKQNDLQRNLDKVVQQMSNLSQKTFAITPEMGKALGQARREMSEAISSMQEQTNSSAMQKQGAAMQHLNEAASLLKGGMEQMMNGSGQGSGMMSMMQQMQQMSQQQMSLNQLTQQLKEGGLSQQQMSQMQRLAQEQEMIRKSLEQMNKEARESGMSKRLGTNLEKILNEMQEVVSGMRTEKLDDDLIQAQERILSKLLDAQRSVNERDFEKERESNSGKNLTRQSPPELILSSEESKDKLRDELMKAIREGYSKDYEDIIRKYYEALQKKEIKK
ncbi:MAG: hypothetical protein CVV23_07510 [Ignavibacteriae bacterium HGW-Ignavibacteriae-2]|nr:MAG: hypothetical protein CVV23_07510 [Ignavibacteriae bacterium HGW-Ignavibacteriae-2]